MPGFKSKVAVAGRGKNIALRFVSFCLFSGVVETQTRRTRDRGRGMPARRIESSHAEAMISKKQNVKNNKNPSKHALGRAYPMSG